MEASELPGDVGGALGEEPISGGGRRVPARSSVDFLVRGGPRFLGIPRNSYEFVGFYMFILELLGSYTRFIAYVVAVAAVVVAGGGDSGGRRSR